MDPKPLVSPADRSSPHLPLPPRSPAKGRERRDSLSESIKGELSLSFANSPRSVLSTPKSASPKKARSDSRRNSESMRGEISLPFANSPRSVLSTPQSASPMKARSDSRRNSDALRGEISLPFANSPRFARSSPKSARRTISRRNSDVIKGEISDTAFADTAFADSRSSPKSAIRTISRQNSDVIKGEISDTAFADSPRSIESSVMCFACSERGLLFVLYFVLSANDGIVKAKSKTVKIHGQPDDFPYALASIMFMSSIVSLCIGVLVTMFYEGRKEGARKCLDWKSIKHITPINLLFQIAFVLKFEALRRLDPDIISMLSQANLVLLALAARAIMKKKYRTSHYISLCLVTTSMCLYLIIRGGITDTPIKKVWDLLWETGDDRIGYCLVLAMIIVETLATVLAETWMKRSQPGQGKPLPFWVQKVHVDFSGLCLLIFWIFLPPLLQWEWLCRPLHSEKIFETGMLSGWNWWTVAVLMMVVSKAWLAGLVSKRFDSVVKQIGSCLAILLTYVEVVIWIDPAGTSISTFACLLLVLLSVISFGDASRSERQKDAGRSTERKELKGRSTERKELKGRSTERKELKGRSTSSDTDWAGNYKSSRLVCATQSVKINLDGSHSDASETTRPAEVAIDQATSETTASASCYRPGDLGKSVALAGGTAPGS